MKIQFPMAKTKRSPVLALLLAAFVTFGVSAGGRTDTENPSRTGFFSAKFIQTLYPASDYITGTGSGANRQNAESAAKLALCQSLGESISGNQQTFLTSSSTGSEQSELSLSVKESVLFEHITGIVIKDCIQDKKGSYSALAVLNRAEAGDYYSTKARKNDLEIQKLVLQATANSTDYNSIALMEKAVAIAKDNQYNLDLLSVISPSRSKSLLMSYGSVSQLELKKGELAKNILFFVKVENDIDGRIFAALTEKLSQKGYSISGDYKTAAYFIKAKVNFEQPSLHKDNNYFVRYTLDCPVIEPLSDKIVATFNFTGREGAPDAKQASSRALTKLCGRIAQEFLE